MRGSGVLERLEGDGMSGHDDPLLAVLHSIDASLKTLVSLSRQRVAKSTGPRVATDRELDGKYGDPQVRFNPRDWTGADFKRRKFSECPADFLEMLAEAFDYLADRSEEKNELTDKGKAVAPFRRADAAKARGWAKRIKDGKHTPPAVDVATDNPWADDVPEWGSEGRA